MSKKTSRVRLFSIKRILLSGVLGFILPFSYAMTLSLISDYTAKPVPETMVYPFGWPRPVWIFLMGREPLEDDLMFGVVFLALCNIALYGLLVYVVLTALQLLRHKRADLDLPPSPHLHLPVE